MKQWKVDKVSSVQIRSMQQILILLKEEGFANKNTTLEELLVYCNKEIERFQCRLDNKSKECYDGYSNKGVQTKEICGGYNGL